jgi:hypothetical protein
LSTFFAFYFENFSFDPFVPGKMSTHFRKNIFFVFVIK